MSGMANLPSMDDLAKGAMPLPPDGTTYGPWWDVDTDQWVCIRWDEFLYALEGHKWHKIGDHTHIIARDEFDRLVDENKALKDSWEVITGVSWVWNR